MEYVRNFILLNFLNFESFAYEYPTVYVKLSRLVEYLMFKNGNIRLRKMPHVNF